MTQSIRLVSVRACLIKNLSFALDRPERSFFYSRLARFPLAPPRTSPGDLTSNEILIPIRLKEKDALKINMNY